MSDARTYTAALMSGDIDSLTRAFAGEPELHHPTRGRVRGKQAFETFVGKTRRWLSERSIDIDHVDVIVTKRRVVEEVVAHLDGEQGPVSVPVAIVAQRTPGGRLDELRVYFSTWPMTGAHAVRPPLLQPNPHASDADVVGAYQRALAAGDADAIVATFEPDGYAREPAGGRHVYRGTERLRQFYELLFSNGGGIALEHCSVSDDGRACALEYNVVRWGRTELRPQAGVAVYVRGASGRLAAARIYDDCDPPLA